MCGRSWRSVGSIRIERPLAGDVSTRRRCIVVVVPAAAEVVGQTVIKLKSVIKQCSTTVSCYVKLTFRSTCYHVYITILVSFDSDNAGSNTDHKKRNFFF